MRMAGNQMIKSREYLLTEFHGCKAEMALYQVVVIFATKALSGIEA
jgi:hypothetical protein